MARSGAGRAGRPRASSGEADTASSNGDATKRKGRGKGGAGASGASETPAPLLKDAVVAAANAAGGPDGLVGYLTARALESPTPFLSLLAKALPMDEPAGPAEEGEGPAITRVEWVVVDPGE